MAERAPLRGDESRFARDPYRLSSRRRERKFPRNERNGLTQWGRLRRIPGKSLSLSIVDRKWPAISFTFAVFQESRINFMLVQSRGRRILASFGSFP